MSCQPFSQKEKKPKKVGNAAVPKKNVVEITYAELFKSVELEQCTIPSEKDPAEELGLLPSWNPFMKSVDPEPLQEDPFGDVWEVMRSARESGSKVSNRYLTFYWLLFCLKGLNSNFVIFLKLFSSGLYFDMHVTSVWTTMLVGTSIVKLMPY